MVALLLVCFFTLCSSSLAVYGATSTWPAPIPLFHKSPYLNAWIGASTNVSASPASKWPRFFNPKDLGWFVGIRVDNISYQIQGDDTSVNYTFANTLSVEILPTQTRFTIAAGPTLVNLTYLTPIDLQDWTFHSFPFSYAAIDITSSDGEPHAIQVYTDTAIQFVSSDDSNLVIWNTSFTANSIYHLGRQKTLQTLTENNDMCEDGSQILAYTAIPDVSATWQTCFSVFCRGNFTLQGKLDNTSDTNFRAINNNWPVLAYALDLGNITKTSNTLVFGIGLTRDPVVSYRNTKTTQDLSHLWYSRWSNLGSAIDDFLTSYSSASSRAETFDNNIQVYASELASQLRMSTNATATLVDLHILNLRQTVGSLEFTTLSPGNPVVMDDVRVFMKDVGFSRRINPVEIMYATFPAFLFLNATLAGKLLEPLLEFQASTLYANDYAAPDLGSSWPIIQGNTTNQSLLGIDSSGAMLIMALAHAQKSGDGTLLFNYYDVFQKWANFLVQSTQQTGSYMSSDGLYSSNANLALKGIMGLYAMGEINKILEARGADTSKTSYYSDTANSYAKNWLNQAVSSDHIMASYGSNSTWAMIYNLFAPRLLGASIIPDGLYETQASYYASLSGNAGTFGLPYDGTQSLAKAHWTLLSASSVFNATTSGGRDDLISMVHSRSFWQSGANANPAAYSPIDGTQPGGAASPAMGAVYSMLALNLPDLAVILPSGSVDKSQSSSNVPVIVGATFGALGGLLLLVTLVLFLRRRRRSKANYINDTLEESSPRQLGPSSNIAPFTGEIRPSIQEYDSGHIVNHDTLPRPTGKAPQNAYPEKFARIPSSGSIRQSVVDSSVAGGGSTDVSNPGGVKSPGDESTLRQEVEQLRRVVETLSAQQAQPQAQVPVDYQPRSLPDEPPPMYPSY